jgi:hypothetical protein
MVQQVPAPSAVLLNQLLKVPGTFTIVPIPIVTVRLPDWSPDSQALAGRLRNEFGTTIDIEVGLKRLGGGPSGRSTSCVLVAPVWAIAEAPPKQLRVTVLIAPSFDRGATVTGTLRVTNAGRRSMWIAPHLSSRSRACGSTSLGEAIAQPGSSLAVNSSKGLPATDAPPTAEPADRLEVMRTESPSGPAWRARLVVCPTVVWVGQRLRPGARIDIPINASTISVTADDQPFLASGAYDLRANFVVAPWSPGAAVPTVSAPGVRPPWTVVAAPVTRFELRD